MLFKFTFVLTVVFISVKRTGFQQEWTSEHTEKEKGVESLQWEVDREDSVSLVFVMLLMSDSLTGNSFKALLYRFQTPPPLLYVTEWVFMWSLLLATPGLHSDLHEYMADGEDRPLSLFIRLCFCLIGCTCLKSLRRLLLFTECVFLSDTLPVSQSAGRVKSVCESLYARLFFRDCDCSMRL